ncbi:Arm DNA-binding domain-containing protein [Spirosoma areae]
MDYNIQTKAKQGMAIKLRKKPLASGKLSLYLDNWDGEQRQYEFLKLYLYPRPKDALEKEHNKETLRTAENYNGPQFLYHRLSLSEWLLT